MFEIIFTIIISAYFLFLILFTTGLKKRFTKNIHFTPFISIIVCARNEENNIKDCLNSLSRLDYPSDKMEIIIVDDNSTDLTGQIINDFIKDKIHFKKLDSHPSNILKGKINALNSGISESKGEILFLTDADCTVEPSWVRNNLQYYTDSTGMVCGFTTLSCINKFEYVQCIDLIYLLSVASGTANIGMPVSCIGNNLSFKRTAYLETGGFENLAFSVTEDFLLMNSIASLKKYSIIFPVDQKNLVHSKACINIKELTAQKKRWGAGGLKGSAYALTIMLIAFLSNLSVFIIPLFFSTVSLYLAVFKISADFFFLYPVHQKLGLKKNLSYFLFYEIYYTIYIIILPVLLLFNKKISWKGREF